MAGRVEKVSYDILEWFPILYCQDVFKHLDGKDVIQASAVNKAWNKFVAESKEIKKLKLVFYQENSRRLTNSDVKMLKNSKRRYQNIVFDTISFKESGHFLQILEDRAGSWKSLILIDCEMYDRGAWSELLKIVEPSVEELSIALERCPEDPVNSRWSFPSLKILEGYDKGYNLFKYFVRCTSLVEFNWPSRAVTPVMKQDMLQLFRGNPNLKDLSSFTDLSLFEQHSPEFEFKLKKLKLGDVRFGMTATLNLYPFLESQSQSLESLEIQAKLNQASLKLILSMPMLASLTIGLHQIEEAILSCRQAFPVNTTIITLDLTSEVVTRQKIPFETLIRALKSLKFIKCDKMNIEAILFLAQVVPATKFRPRW